MGQDVEQAFESARTRFEEANRILGRDIRGLCFGGPEDELKATQNTQPALFTVEAVLVDALRDRGVAPSFAAGHSLGEYAALYAAGVFSFEQGLRLVATRGELMAQAGRDRPGTMAAVIGLPVERICEVLEGIDSGVVVPANQNTPEQTVISGEVGAVSQACDLLKQAGARRAVQLPVSGAFHSPLMKPAAERFAGALASVQFRAPECPVISNVTATPESDPDRLKQLLIEQLVSPVRWVETVLCLRRLDHGTCIEVGPGAVIKGLVKGCAEDLAVVSCGSAEQVYSVSSSSGV